MWCEQQICSQAVDNVERILNFLITFLLLQLSAAHLHLTTSDSFPQTTQTHTQMCVHSSSSSTYTASRTKILKLIPPGDRFQVPKSFILLLFFLHCFIASVVKGTLCACDRAVLTDIYPIIPLPEWRLIPLMLKKMSPGFTEFWLRWKLCCCG